jgi:hypothetical protein
MGHPLGATGAMILGTVLDELERTGKSTALSRSASAPAWARRRSSSASEPHFPAPFKGGNPHPAADAAALSRWEGDRETRS